MPSLIRLFRTSNAVFAWVKVRMKTTLSYAHVNAPDQLDMSIQSALASGCVEDWDWILSTGPCFSSGR
jgi:hypothetical protein